MKIPTKKVAPKLSFVKRKKQMGVTFSRGDEENNKRRL